MVYKIKYSEIAKEDILSIFDYINKNLQAPMAARDQTERIRERVSSLKENPARYKVYSNKTWHGRELRICPIDNYLIIYTISKEKKLVIIARIMYGQRDIDSQLESTHNLE